MLKPIIAGLISFLVVLGCLSIYNRESSMLNNQMQLASAVGQLEQRVILIEKFLNQQIKSAQERVRTPPMLEPEK